MNWPCCFLFSAGQVAALIAPPLSHTPSRSVTASTRRETQTPQQRTPGGPSGTHSSFGVKSGPAVYRFLDTTRPGLSLTPHLSGVWAMVSGSEPLQRFTRRRKPLKRLGSRFACHTSSSIKVKPQAADQPPFRLAVRKRPDLFIVNLCQVVPPAETIGFSAEPVADTIHTAAIRPAPASKNQPQGKPGAHDRFLRGGRTTLINTSLQRGGCGTQQFSL